MRVVGLDTHRRFAEAALIEEGHVRHLGRVDLVREKVIAFAKKLGADAEVVVEATGNTIGGVWQRRTGELLRRHAWPDHEIQRLTTLAALPTLRHCGSSPQSLRALDFVARTFNCSTPFPTRTLERC